MKKILAIIGMIIVSLLITFFIFEIMSWYDFGGPITNVVLVRLMLCFMVIFTSLLGIILLIKKVK